MAWPTVSIQVAFTAPSIKDLSGTLEPFANLTPYVLRWGYRRGRQRQLQRAEAGTAYFELDNADGRFDPENPWGPYYDGAANLTIGNGMRYEGDGLGMRPGRHLYISAVWGGVTYHLFYGYITKWLPLELEGKREPIVRVEAADMLYWIGRGPRSIAVTGGQYTGEAIEQVLTASPISFSSAFTNLDQGTVVTSGLAVGAHNVLSTIHSYADTEDLGILYVNGLGQFTYHDHLRRLARERSIVRQFTFDNSPAAQAAGALPFNRVQYVRDDTDYYNSIAISTDSAGALAAITSATLVARHEVRQMSRSTRHLSTTDAQRLQTRLFHRYARLIGQHTTLTLNGAAGPDALWPAILGIEISDQIRVVERLYPVYPPLRTRIIDSWIEGLQVDVEQSAGTGWRVVFQLSPILSDLHWKIGGKGVAFPTSPSDNDLYYREDLDILAYYNSGLGAWVTVQSFEAPLQAWAVLPVSAAGIVIVGSIAGSPSYTRYVEAIQLSTYVDTTNNGSNFWTLSVLNQAGTTLASTSTAGQAANTYVTTDLAVLSSTTQSLRLAVAKTGAPGPIYAIGMFRYRLIVP
jgi:hypothetical protein